MSAAPFLQVKRCLLPSARQGCWGRLPHAGPLRKQTQHLALAGRAQLRAGPIPAKLPDPVELPHANCTVQEQACGAPQGLAALLVQGLSGCAVEQVARLSPEWITAMGLSQSLTPSRNNGFLNMYQLMQKKALALLVSAGPEAVRALLLLELVRMPCAALLGLGCESSWAALGVRAACSACRVLCSACDIVQGECMPPLFSQNACPEVCVYSLPLGKCAFVCRVRTYVVQHMAAVWCLGPVDEACM